MPHSEFVHLHLHTQFSLLDGACRIPELLACARQYKMDSLAITDHGSMFGAIDFYLEAQKAGIKPIIGCEVYVAPTTRFEKKPSVHNEGSYHFILLARDEEGYQNLMKMVSSAYLEGFYYRPRIDKDLLAKHSKGLIGLSACLRGEVPQMITQRRYNDALKAADDYRSILGKNNFYLELQVNGIPEQITVNVGLVKIAKELGLPVVATNDVHYLLKDHARAHEALLCIQTQTTLNDPNRMKLSSNEFYFKSPQEMKLLFDEVPDAITNTVEIANRCNLELNFKQLHLPRYEVPGNKSKDEFLSHLCEQGLRERFQTVTPEIQQRLEHELKTIQSMGFTSYFLIVWDFIHYAKSQGIPVGPGRGSAAGSIVSYLLGITDINPLRYGLLFERFLNPERIGMPDIDIDFCYERRPEVINYVTHKYGRENVAQIITFGTMQARAVIRDVGRAMGMAYADVDRIAKMIPPDPEITLKDALKSEPELDRMYASDDQMKQLIDTAITLEGLNRHASIHAAGVVIGDKPLDNYMPLFKTQDDQITTGYSMSVLEKIGLLKMDFLGLRTLTVIDQATKIIEARHGKKIDIRTLPLDDPATYKLLGEAKTFGVFQVESSGMRDLLKKLQPDKFEDLIALLALYRPGPIGSGMLDDFIARKHGHVPIRFDHKKLEPILKETYGIMVYQEQIIQIVSTLAGFSLSQADLLRRAISKKDPEVMDQQRKNFILGCSKNSIAEPTASKIFDFIDHFSGYGFNKSHSAAYAVISYRTAFLKANYPVEFMTALLTSERDTTDKIVEYVSEAKRMGIEILPPDINASDALFLVVDDRSIRFGLLAIKNVGQGAIESVIQARLKGPFLSLDDLCQRIDLRLVNRKVLESLIKAGALDNIGKVRAQMFTELDRRLEAAGRIQKDRIRGQLSFFDQTSATSFAAGAAENFQIKEWPEHQLLSFEKDMLGFYVSGHPLARYASVLSRFTSTSVSNLAQHKDDEEVKIIGLIAKIKHTLTRAKQEKMAILKIEDLEGAVEILVFPQAFQKISRAILPNTVVLVKGRLNLRENTPKIIANDMLPIEELYNLISGVSINLSGMRENLFESLKAMLAVSPGKTPVYLHLDSSAKSRVQVVVGNGLFVQPNEKLIGDIENLIGADRLSLVI